MTTVPFFRPSIGEEEIREVVETLRSGWLTTGPRVKRFEEGFAAAVGARHALAVSSGTAALHLALEAVGLEAGHAVLVPAMTFAATAEVVRYQGAVPVLVDCDPVTLNIDLADAEAKLEALEAGALPCGALPAVGIIPVHVGGLMVDIDAVANFALRHGLWTVEDAAHAFPAAQRTAEGWRRCGDGTSRVACFSFYANKTITTGEGGMAVTDDEALAARMRVMCLHGLSHDAWERYSGGPSWDYRIIAPGFKYNMSDIAAALGVHQLARAGDLREQRAAVARRYLKELADLPCLDLPPDPGDRRHAWHLYPVRLRLDVLDVDRDSFIDELKAADIGCSVHWRPLHLHPYYEGLGWRPEHCPVATAVWRRLISLPLFPGMTEAEIDAVTDTVRGLCARHGR